MATRPLASTLPLCSPPKTPAPSPSFLRRIQTLTRALSSASPQAMASPSPPAKKVLVPIANGTEPMEAVITIDVLRRAGADVAVASVEPGAEQVAAAWGVKIAADGLLSDLADAEFDLISLPGGMPGSSTFRDCKLLESMVKKHTGKGKLYAAICAAPAMALGTWGLLNGLKATCYPSFMDKLPSEVNAVESRVQIDGKCVTSRGPGTAMEYSVVLVEQLYGKEKAEEVAGPMIMRPQHAVEFSMKELNSTSWNVGEAPQILVPIANGTEEMEAIMIIDILRRAKANVVVVSIEETLEIVASRKVKMIADVLLDDALKQQYDLILLPGGLGGAQAYANSDKLIGLIKKQAEANKLYGAICASPAIALEPHGLLKGKKATSYPAMWKKLSDQSECLNRVVVDGNLITSQGPGTSMEFSLAIVEKLFGRERAPELAKTMDIPGCGKFRELGLQNEEELTGCFGDITTIGSDHWSPYAANIITSKRPARPVQDKGKRCKIGTALLIQEAITNIASSAKEYASKREGKYSIEQVMEVVLACGAGYETDEHYIATKLFVKKEQREMFMTLPSNEIRFNWLRRKYNDKYSK